MESAIHASPGWARLGVQCVELEASTTVVGLFLPAAKLEQDSASGLRDGSDRPGRCVEGVRACACACACVCARVHLCVIVW